MTSPATVTWTKNSGGKFEVVTKQHLLQIMNKGALYTDAGDAPTDYWASAYLQTSDIDLGDDHASIVPIGNSTTKFTGDYDGDLFQIKNWSYAASSSHSGMFGYCTGSLLKDIHLSGVWTSSGGAESGFLAGRVEGSSTVYGIEGDFAEGTSLDIDGNSDERGTILGVMDGYSEMSASTVRGTVDFGSSTSPTYTGGVVGKAYSGLIDKCRNFASFPNGIGGQYSGGIAAVVSRLTISSCLNGMTGDIVGTIEGGGVVGRANQDTTADSLVNSMTGNTKGATTGGIIGNASRFDTRVLTASRLLNYMHGDLEGTTYAGGIVGQLQDASADTTITKSVVAMRGNVMHAVVDGITSVTPSVIEVTVDTSFGMTYTSNDYGSATMVVDNALVYHPQFADLPYIDINGNDPEVSVYKWDFVFANVGGKAGFEKYTHLSLHKGEVSTPFYADFGLAQSNSVVYATYANTGEKSLYIDNSLTVVETEADIAFDYDKSTIVYGTPDPSETLAWTKNADGKFEVATVKHMLQLMSGGSKFTDMGDHPTEYWSSAYIQTDDIDLVDEHASIVPIGNDTTQFTGEYDGGLFQISNWSYTGNEQKTGLFGYCNDARLTHIRLAGAWSLSAGGYYSGFLCAYAEASTMYDVQGDFASGTILAGAGVYGGGSLLGLVHGGLMNGLSVSGIVDMDLPDCQYVGGVVGYLRTGAALYRCRNIAAFTNGIAGISAGGVIGAIEDANIFSCFNGMTGDVIGTSASGELTLAAVSGGVCGCVFGTCEVVGLLNSMSGNISAATKAGGIVGLWSAYDLTTATGERMLNYMKGDILGLGGAGGLIGSFTRGNASGDVAQYGQVSITSSVVAMQGNVEQSVRGIEDFAPSTLEVTVDTSFGMFFDTNDYGSSTMVTHNFLYYAPAFPDLPYFKMSGNDQAGNLYEWDFLFANIGGKFPQYTHLSVHTSSEILFQIPTTFGPMADNNATVYLTYANVDENSMYIDSSLTIVETTAAVVFDHAKTVVVYGTPTPATTMTWTTDADDGKFEVATKQHLLQLMNRGALYTDLGAVRPSAYWTHHYVQTAEIDLQNDAEHVVCIGDEDTSFVGSFEHDGFEVLNWQHGDEHARLFGDRTTLMWTQDAEGRYQVESVQHLLQIMERGERFVNEGDFPSDHWGASTQYIQTADVDLQDWHAKIHPIGNATTNFFGQYDGGGHAISNWSYTQPEDSPVVSATGLFGAVTDAEIKGVRLNGVWTLNGSAHASTYLGDGFLCGSATAATVYDVESEFSTGTLMAGGSSTTAPITHRVGGLIGYASESVVCNVALKGTVDLKDFNVGGHNTYVGGVIGYVINASSSVSLCRNVATFPDGITGKTAGGLIGYFHMGTLSHSLNAMQGDVVGNTHAGGVCGMHATGGSCEVVVNAMTGSIQATENAGGVHGCVDASLTTSSSQLLNYMSGNVVGTNAGGVVGLVKRSVETGDVNIANSIVAMNGTVSQPIGGSLQFEPSALDAVVNTDFGMVFQKQILVETTINGFSSSPAFPDLSYIALEATDPDGIIQTCDFVFANLGGKSVYSGLFTHLALHTTTVSAPFATDFGLDFENTQVYLTYAHLAKSEIFVDDALTIADTAASIAYNHAKSAVLLGSASLPLICEPRALTIRAGIDAPALSLQLQLTYQETAQGSREIVAHNNFLDSAKVVTGLSPETTYAIKLYVNEVLAEHVLVTTAANAVENYVVSDFFDVEEELYDISAVGDNVSAEVVNELFTTGDIVEVDMNFARKTTMETTFVKKGELVEVDRSGAVLLPFDLSTSETQQSTIKLSDTTSVQVGLVQGTGEISVGGTTYPSGKSFIMDGRKCTAFDI